MPIVVEAVYEDGVLKPDSPLPLSEHQRVRATLEPQISKGSGWQPLIECEEIELINRAALDPELDF